MGQTPVFIGGAKAQHGAVGSEVLIRDIPGLSGIRPGNPILAGATSFARGSDQKERVACESCVQGTVCRNRFRSPSSPDGRVGLGVSRIRLALSHLVSHPKTFGRARRRSPFADQGAAAAEGARRATGDAAGNGRGGRFSARRKRETVLRLLRGEDLESVSRELGITAARASQWRDQFLAAGQASLKSRAPDARDEANRRLQAKIGEFLMENELLYAKVDQLEAAGPLARRRSRR